MHTNSLDEFLNLFHGYCFKFFDSLFEERIIAFTAFLQECSVDPVAFNSYFSYIKSALHARLETAVSSSTNSMLSLFTSAITTVPVESDYEVESSSLNTQILTAMDTVHSLVQEKTHLVEQYSLLQKQKQLDMSSLPKELIAQANSHVNVKLSDADWTKISGLLGQYSSLCNSDDNKTVSNPLDVFKLYQDVHEDILAFENSLS
ncbi:hypothetical protein RCL1_002009 [Eukaryota sp. TZLM3-RCL]